MTGAASHKARLRAPLLSLLAVAGSLLTLAASPASAQTQYVTNYTWDANRRLVYEIAPDPDGAGPQARTTVRHDYDAMGRETSTRRGTSTSATGAGFTAIETVDFAFSPTGQVARQTGPGGITQYAHDALDRVTCTAVRMNPATYGALPADACTPATTGGFGPDRITRDSHDAVGRVIQTRRGVGTAQEQIYATREYTPSGQLAWVRDAANNRTTLEYDGFDRLSRLRYPVTTVGADASSTTDLEAYAYDQASNRTRLWRRGQNPADPAQAIVYTYDALNRETVRDYPGGTSMDVYTTYDLQNRVLSARLVSTSGSGILATYDRAGRMLTEATMGRTLTYQYDAASNRTRMTWPDGLYLQTDHDPASRPTAMRENGAASGPGVLASFAYDGLSRRTGLTRGNGTVTAYSFDTAGRLSGLTQDVASTAFDQAWTMAYNPAAQIAALDGWNSAWTAPPPAVPGGSTAWAHDGLNRITGLSWDARGNLIGDGTRTFTYDLENRLLNVTSGGINVAQLLYDPQGRPYRMGPSAAPVFTLYSGPMLVAEYDAGGTLLRRHVPGPGVDEPLVTYEGAGTTDRRWLHADRQGSIAAWSDGSGVVNASRISTYGPWGEPTAWAGPRYRYTGQIAMPEAQLYHYKARVYDPVLGRFLQTDPIGFQDQLNLYAYVAGDPVNATDPTGMVYDDRTGMHHTRGGCREGIPCLQTPPSAVEGQAGAGTAQPGAATAPGSVAQSGVRGRVAGAAGALVESLTESWRRREQGYIRVYRLHGVTNLYGGGNCDGGGACWSTDNMAARSGYREEVARNLYSVYPSWNSFEYQSEGWVHRRNVVSSRPADPVGPYDGGGNETSIKRPESSIEITSTRRVIWQCGILPFCF